MSNDPLLQVAIACSRSLDPNDAASETDLANTIAASCGDDDTRAIRIMAECVSEWPSEVRPDLARITKAIRYYIRRTPVAETASAAKAAPGDIPLDVLTDWDGYIGIAVRDMAETSTIYQPALALATTLAVFGAVFGRLLATPTDLRTNLYTIGLCPTGGGKEGPRTYWKKIITASKGSGILHPELIASEGGIYSSVKKNPSGIFMIDEIGRMMQSVNGKNSGNHEKGILTALLSLFSQANSVFSGKAFADQTRRPVEPIIEPCVCVSGTGNADDFWSAFTSQDVTNGFLPRLLIFQTPDKVPEPNYTQKRNFDERILGVLDRWNDYRTQNFLSEMSGNLVHHASYGKGAERLWTAYQKDIHARRNRSKDRVDIELLTRLWENASKVALISAGARYEPADVRNVAVSADDTDRAIRLVECLYETTKWHVGRNVSENDYHKDLNKVLKIIESAGQYGVTKRDLLRRIPGIQPRQREDILSSLDDAGMIVRSHEPTGGRPREVIVSALHYSGSL